MNDYEKKYKEALNKAKDILSNKEVRRENMEYLFPELKESDDEKIREELIGFLRNIPNSNYTCEEMAHWLEKQGEQKPQGKTALEAIKEERVDNVNKVAPKFNVKYAGNLYNVFETKDIAGVTYYGIEDEPNHIDYVLPDNCEIVSGQKLADKVEPKFNIGDVICDKSCTTLNKEAQPNMEIVDILNGMYICDKGSFPVSQQDEYVLVSKKIDSKLNDESVSNELREASFAHAEREMKNQTFPDNLEFELIYTFEEGAKWNAAQNPTAWSKDDDNNIGMIESRLIDLLSYTRKDNSLTKRRKNTIKEEVVGYVNWLTSLIDRYTWKPSDEQMKAFENFVRGICESGYASPYENNTKLLYSLLEQLKKLK